MNDYETNSFRITDTARMLRVERLANHAEDWAEYEEWLSETDGESYEGRERDWRFETALDAWDSHLETPW